MKKTHLLRNNAGFTMIEMLVVIILIGIVVSMTIKYVGGGFSNASVQQGAISIADDTRGIYETAQRYKLEKAADATGLTGSATALTVAVASDGKPFMTMVPVAPTTGVSGSYTWDAATYTNTWGTAAADAVVEITVTSTAVCSQINQQFAGLAANAVPPVAVDGTKDVQCFGPAGGPYKALKTIYIN